MYRKATLRRLPPETRELARMIGELESVTRRAKNLLSRIADMERENIAERKRQQHYGMGGDKGE